MCRSRGILRLNEGVARGVELGDRTKCEIIRAKNQQNGKRGQAAREKIELRENKSYFTSVRAK